MKIKNFQTLTILAKSSVLDVRLASGCASVETLVLMLHLLSPKCQKGMISRINGLSMYKTYKETVYDAGFGTNGPHIK